MNITLMISAVVALAAGAVIGWLATKAHADQIRADLIGVRFRRQPANHRPSRQRHDGAYHKSNIHNTSPG
ncbi:hypothetical protein RYZ99_24005, partial [Salmonella enterica subsp. enterica serovar Enteritidis]|uniref:hypothetical protein n=1 Tax=Salmonella enterica TaxID=28901 RepID=UPI0029643B90